LSLWTFQVNKPAQRFPGSNDHVEILC
jgi:hypothetical protein